MKALFSFCPCSDPSQFPGAQAGHASVRTGGSGIAPGGGRGEQVGLAQEEDKGQRAPGAWGLSPRRPPTGLNRDKISISY